MKIVFNQLKLGNRNGLFSYNNLVDFYTMVLNAWYSQYPDGKIDYMRFMMDWTRLSGAEIYRITEDMMNQVVLGDSVIDTTVVVVDWDNLNECRRKLSYLMSALCYCVNEVECFNALAFDKAITGYFSRRK